MKEPDATATDLLWLCKSLREDFAEFEPDRLPTIDAAISLIEPCAVAELWGIAGRAKWRRRIYDCVEQANDLISGLLQEVQ